MCLAIVKLPFEEIPEEYLERAFVANPDGAGFAIARNGTLLIKKGFFTFKSFLKAWRKHSSFVDAALVHFRVATSGKINKFNCHPWALSDTVAMIHNGVLPWAATDVMSDTGCFVQEIMMPSKSRIRDERFRIAIEDFIGLNNKLAFLDASGSITIYNEESGHWEGGVWYSNHSYFDWTELDDAYADCFDEFDDVGRPAWTNANERGIAF